MIEFNKEIIKALEKKSCKAKSITIKENNIIYVEQENKELGYVGKPVKVNTDLLNDIIQKDFVPIVTPMGLDQKGQAYNINADTTAGALARSLKSRRLLLATDVEGVLDKNEKLISEIRSYEAEKLINDQTIHGGMIPKIKTCIEAVNNSVRGVVIIDGRRPHSILFELFFRSRCRNSYKKMKELKSIKYWIFDLDNTLYSGKTKVFEQVDKKMSEYISKKLNVSTAKAKEIQKNYFHEYNTTLNGMIKNHEINADEFLEFVHNVNIDFLKKDPMLGEELKKLNGKKIIFTNGSKKHALNVTKRIGIDHYFDGIFDIIDSEFVPKPAIQSYKKLVEKHKIDPKLCVFVEDIARNLKPAYEMGMKTVWIENDEPWAKKFSDGDFIDFKTNNLSEFLKQINLLKAA